jgi:hypothetical protein
MTRIQQVAFGLFALSVLAVLVVAGGYAFHLATYRPPLYTPPPEMRSHSNVKMVRDAQNLEGLRKVCELWAEMEDRSRAMLSMQIQTFDQWRKGVAIGLAVFGCIFAVGLAYIYAGLRRLQRSAPNAL